MFRARLIDPQGAEIRTAEYGADFRFLFPERQNCPLHRLKIRLLHLINQLRRSIRAVPLQHEQVIFRRPVENRSGSPDKVNEIKRRKTLQPERDLITHRLLRRLMHLIVKRRKSCCFRILLHRMGKHHRQFQRLEYFKLHLFPCKTMRKEDDSAVMILPQNFKRTLITGKPDDGKRHLRQTYVQFAAILLDSRHDMKRRTRKIGRIEINQQIMPRIILFPGTVRHESAFSLITQYQSLFLQTLQSRPHGDTSRLERRRKVRFAGQTFPLFVMPQQNVLLQAFIKCIFFNDMHCHLSISSGFRLTLIHTWSFSNGTRKVSKPYDFISAGKASPKCLTLTNSPVSADSFAARQA